MNHKNWHRFILVSSIISFFLLSYALIIIAANPTRGYELSIYSATPLIFWIAIIICILNGIFIIVLSLFNKIDNFEKLGMFSIIFSNSLMLIIYALRRYIYIERSDALSYIGYAKEISNLGFFSDNNFYPLIGILISQLYQMTNISHIYISQYLPSIFYIFLYLSIYSLAKSYTSDKKFIFSTVLASAPIFFAWFSPTVHYMSLSVLTIILILFLIHKNYDMRYRILSIIFIFIYPFFHPITAMFIFLYLVVIFVSNRLFEDFNVKISSSFLLITFVSISAWFISQYMILRNVESILIRLFSSFSPTSMDQAANFSNKLGIITALKSYLLMNGDEIIFYFLSLIGVYFVVLKYNKEGLEKKLIPIILCFITGNILLIGLFIFSSIHTPYRLLNINPNILLTPFIVGYLLYRFSIKNNKIICFLLVFLIVLATFTSIISLYPSPITALPTTQVTTSEVTGMAWLISQKSFEFRTADEKLAVFRFADLLYGSDFRYKRSDLERDWIFLDHFGVSNGTHFSIDRDRYLVISEYVVKAHTEVWKNLHAFDQEDFDKIDFFQNVNKIYVNGEFWVYLVHKP